MQIPSMPFRILALAPVSFTQEKPWPDGPRHVDKTNLDHVMENMVGSFYVSLPNTLCPAGGVNIACKGIADLHPDGLTQTVPFLRHLLEAKNAVRESRKQGASGQHITTVLQQWPDLPPVKVHATTGKAKKKPASSAVDDILNMVAMPEDTQISSGESATVTAQLDQYLQQTLGHIFSSDEFRRVEATWRGIKLLVEQETIDGNVELQVVPTTFETLAETLDNLTVSLVQSLPSLVLVDLPCNNSPLSLEYLEKMAQFAETLLAPTIGWVTHAFFHLESWGDLHKLSYLPHYLDEPSFAKWRSLANVPSAHWLAVTCNRFLIRYPYGVDNKPRVAPFSESRPLWISPVWAIGALITQSQTKKGWPTRLTDWQEIRLENLALDTTDPTRPISTETAIPEDRISQFASAGITPLLGYRDKDMAFVLDEATVGKSSLSYQMFLSRITHFVLWCKDSLGQTLAPKALEDAITQALSLFWEKTGDPAPKSMDVSVSDPDSEGRLLVKIAVTPSRRVLLSGQKAELEFYW